MSDDVRTLDVQRIDLVSRIGTVERRLAEFDARISAMESAVASNSADHVRAQMTRAARSPFGVDPDE